MVWSASVAEVVSRVTIGLGVMMALTGVTRGSIPSPTTCVHIVSMCGCHKSTNGETAYPEREILGGKDAAQVFVLVDDQDAVSPLRRAKLTRVRDAHAMRDGQGGEGPEGRDGALLGSRDALATGGGTRGGAGALRARSLAREFAFDLLADGLRIQWAGAGCVSVQLLGKRRTLMPFSERLQLPETLDAYATPQRQLRRCALAVPSPTARAQLAETARRVRSFNRPTGARREPLTSSRLDWRLRVSARPSELAGGVLGTVLVVER